MELVTKTKSGVEAILKGKPCDDITLKIPQGEFKGYWGKLGTAEGFTCSGKINGKDTQICAQIPRTDWDKFIIGIKLELEKNVPGLYILNSAINDEIDYRKNFDRMMEDEQNDGVNPPVEPQNKSADVAKQYPVAAAYLKAEKFEFSNNYMKSAAGAKAKRIIGQGGDYIKAIEEMEKEWNDYCLDSVD